MISDPYAPAFGATCSVCELEIIGTLTSDPTVPIYRCGYAGRGHELVVRDEWILARESTHNLEPLSELDCVELAQISAALTFAELPTIPGDPGPRRVPVVGPCDVTDCDWPGIDGRCLRH